MAPLQTLQTQYTSKLQTLVHDTRRLLDPGCEDQDTGLVILNNKSAISLDMIDGSLFGRSRTVVCADGGVLKIRFVNPHPYTGS